jgi:hypothetical protein
MKVGDKVHISKTCPVYIEPFYKQHGIIISKSMASDDPNAWLVVEFADGVVENYRDYELDPLTDKEYFKLQLEG